MLNPLKFLSNFIKPSNQRELDRIQKTVDLINSLEPKIKELTDQDFPKKTLTFKEKLKAGEIIDDLLP